MERDVLCDALCETTGRALVYDVEIEKGISQGRRIPGIEYCEGWEDKQNMGISVICAYTYWDATYHVFCEDNFGDFQELVQSATEIIGFNSESFDDVVCSYSGLTVKTTYDILREVYKSLGFPPYPDHFSHKYKGYGLNALCKTNNIGKKIGHGASAPVLWQQGKIGQVINYCLRDVRMTKGLFDKIITIGCLKSPKGGRFIGMRYNKSNVHEERS